MAMEDTPIRIKGGADPHMVAAVTAAMQQLLTEEAAAAAIQPPPPHLSPWAMQARRSSQWEGNRSVDTRFPSPG